MELGSKWHSYKPTPAEDGLAAAASVAIRTVCVPACVSVCVSSGQQKRWRTAASEGDVANLNTLRDLPKTQEDTSV